LLAEPYMNQSPEPAKGIASRLRGAARAEFSVRGYHGARVQGIARRAGCNVALLYRHWSSKKALYLDLLKAVWTSVQASVSAVLAQGSGAEKVVGAYLQALLSDPEGAQILVREYLDGSPFLSQLVQADPALIVTIRQAAQSLVTGNGSSLRPGVDPLMAALTIGGLAALAASAEEATRPFLDETVPIERWRRHLTDLLLHGLVGPVAT
jgi:TetR/AcrR family transcriptional regulator